MAIVDHADNPIPPGAIAGHVVGDDGVRLRHARWVPAGARAKGTVVLVQGRAEFLEKYYETVRDLLVRGFAVASFDWRGQGGSARLLRDPRKGHVDSFADYEADLDTVMSRIIMPECPPPYYALGHSTGATVLLRAAPNLRRRFRRLFLVAPFLGLGDYGWSPGIVPPLTRFLSGLGLSKQFVFGTNDHTPLGKPFETNRLTSDPARYRRNRTILEANPGLGVGAPTIGWLEAAIDTMALLADLDFIEKIQLPLLIVSAGADRIVSNTAIERFARSHKGGHLVVIDGARHELLQEADIYREQLLAAFDAFVPGT